MSKSVINTVKANKLNLQRNKNLATDKNTVVKVIFTVFVAVCSISMLLPFVWMLSASFKRPADIFQFPIKWIPPYWYPDNYKYIFAKENSILLMYFNSIKITGINVVGSILTSSLAAYAFSKMKFKEGMRFSYSSRYAYDSKPGDLCAQVCAVYMAWPDK